MQKLSKIQKKKCQQHNNPIINQQQKVQRQHDKLRH